jgi:hypothetical protein
MFECVVSLLALSLFLWVIWELAGRVTEDKNDGA